MMAVSAGRVFNVNLPGWSVVVVVVVVVVAVLFLRLLFASK